MNNSESRVFLFGCYGNALSVFTKAVELSLAKPVRALNQICMTDKQA